MFEAVTQEEIWYTLQEIQGLSVLEKIIFGAFLELTLLSRNLQDGVKNDCFTKLNGLHTQNL